MNFNYDKFWEIQNSENTLYAKFATDWKIKNLLELISPQSSESIVDIGCGSGALLEKVAAELKPTTISGIDISDKALSAARTEIKCGIFIKSNLEKKLPFKDKSFDIAIVCDILEHVKCPKDLAKEAQRISKYTVFKIPLENAHYWNLLEKMGRYESVGGRHSSGHLYKWNRMQARSLIETGTVIKEFARSQLPVNLKIKTKKGILREIMILLEKIIYWLSEPLHIEIFSGSLFLFVENK